MTYNTIKYYKLFWYNSDLFQVTNLNFIKRYAVFGKRSKMLRSILKRVLRKTKKFLKRTRSYKYISSRQAYHLKNTSNVVSLAGLLGRKFTVLKKAMKLKRFIKKSRRKRPIFFKKSIFKSLIEGRQLIKLIFHKNNKGKRVLRSFISASAHTTFFERITKLELCLFNLILRSKFTTSIKDTLMWIKQGFILVNGITNVNPYSVLTLGDRLQFTISNRLFIYKKTYLQKTKKDIVKLKAKLWLKSRGKFNLFRKRSKLWPKWILRTTYYQTLIPNFLEVDYLTLTSVIIFLPKMIIEYNSVLWRYLNIYNFRLYNWKITN